MAIIYNHDKRSGRTYAYESHSYWDKEKKMTRAHRTLIGRVDPVTGEITATDGRGHKGNVKKEPQETLDYKVLYEKLEQRHTSQEILIVALQKEIAALKRQR